MSKFTEPIRDYFAILNKIKGNLLNLTHKEQSLFLEAIINGHFITSVSDKELKDNILGRGDNQTVCWFFSRRVAAYLSSLHKVELKDLKDMSGFNNIGKVCDYKIEDKSDGTVHLYELKSMYKEGADKANAGDIIKKIKSRINEYQEQLTNTEKYLECTAVKHFCVDISRYVDNFNDLKNSTVGEISFMGFTDTDIQNILSGIDIKYFDIDNLSICWKKTFYHNETGTPIGILYDSMSKISTKSNIGWWMQEAYYRKSTPGTLTEYRLACEHQHQNKRDINYFFTAFNNYYDPGSSWGEWKEVK